MAKVADADRFFHLIYGDIRCHEMTYVVIRSFTIGLFGADVFLYCKNEDKHTRFNDCMQPFLTGYMNEYDRTTRHEN